jgi:hypothetical protein
MRSGKVQQGKATVISHVDIGTQRNEVSQNFNITITPDSNGQKRGRIDIGKGFSNPRPF